MTRSLFAAVPAALILASCTSMRGAEAPHEALRQHEILVRYGRSHLSSDYKPFDVGEGGAVEYSWGLPRSPWRFFGGISQTADDVRIDQTFTEAQRGRLFEDDVRFQAKTREIYGGVRHEWTAAKGWVKPYVGGGLSYTEGSIRFSPPPPFFDHPSNSDLDEVPARGSGRQRRELRGLRPGRRRVPHRRRVPTQRRLALALPARVRPLRTRPESGDYQLLGMSFGWRF